MFTRTIQEKRNTGKIRLNQTDNVFWLRSIRFGNRFLPGWVIMLISSVMVFGMLTGPVTAFVTPESISVAGNLYISNVTYDPEVFFTGDSGTVAVEVTNSAPDQGIAVNHATMVMDKNFKLMSPSYDYSTNIGPGKSQKFIFSVSAAGNDGKGYQTFSLSVRGADNLWQTTMVEVDNTPPELSVHTKPDTFSPGKKDTIDIQVANPRDNAVKNVILEISGDEVTVSPSRIFIGTMNPGESKILSPSITPSNQTLVSMNLMYDNGDNHHETKTDFPVKFETNKKSASPVLSNVVVENDDGLYHVSGDVTNAGLETANAVTVTSLPPAKGEDPFRTCIVGALKADDFASFEVTFSSDATPDIPLQVSYKDADGNLFTTVQDVTLEKITSPGSGSSPAKKTSADSSSIHNLVIHALTGIVMIALLGIAALFVYNRMKKR